ncbi:MAG: hypothetical protein IKM00_07515 [Clostridia bacterium]|nr:hypothetical protein [Clostridia bacterium]
MYSRSYGSIETDRKNDGISIPANYNGSLYASGRNTQEASKKTEPPPGQEEAPVLTDDPPEPTVQPVTGAVGSLLEKFTAEDIILFILVFSLLKEETADPGTILAVILALLLL